MRDGVREVGEYPLQGIRVLDFSHVLAGPSCARILCDLGAEVIKVEPPAGDLSRRLGARRGGISGYFMQQNCGKLNVSLDLKQQRGREIALLLAGACDIMVENFKPGVMASLGLDCESVMAKYPRLIYCSISGFGHQSPLRQQRAFAGIAHAQTGVLHRQAACSGTLPVDSALAVGDTVSGLQSVIAILAALHLRERSGRGQFIDMAMHDALLAIQEAANFYLFGDSGSDTDFLSSWIYVCEGEYIAVPSDPRAQWDDFAALMEAPGLLEDPRYDSFAKRSRRLDELEAIVAAWVAGQPSADAAVAKLHAAGMAGAKILRMSEALDSEQSRARNMTPQRDDRSGGKARVLNSPYRFSQAQAGVRGRPAFRGEHNSEVLTSLLGLGEDEIAELETQGVLSSRLPGRKH